MLAAIEKITVKERIRKEISKITELAEDIALNGLLHPVTVMAADGEGFFLLAGLRRIRAVQALGMTEIEVNIVSPANAEAALRIEISENEQREPFTFSEKMDFARLIEEIEREKALTRKSIGGKGGFNEDSDRGHCLEKGRSNDAVGSKIGMSGRQYGRAKYIAENAPEEVIGQLDKGERTIRGTYDELRGKSGKKTPLPAANSEDAAGGAPDTAADYKPPAPKRACDVSEEEQMKRLSVKDREAIRKIREFEAMPPEEKITELQRQLQGMRVRAAAAESDLADLKVRYEISVDHKDSIIESLKRQVAELSAALDAANRQLSMVEQDHSFPQGKTE